MAKRKSQSRSARWQDAVQAARDALSEIEAKAEDLNGAMEDLRSVQEEYQDWLDNLPDSLQSSPVGEKLQAVTDLDFDLTIDLDEISGALDEAEQADLPQGWGRD